MKQKELTKKQEEIVERLHDVIAEADAADIGLAFDTWDKTLHAFNAENVSCNYGCIYGATENDENLDKDKCLTMEVEIEPYNSQCGNFILEFEE